MQAQGTHHSARNHLGTETGVGVISQPGNHWLSQQSLQAFPENPCAADALLSTVGASNALITDPAQSAQPPWNNPGTTTGGKDRTGPQVAGCCAWLGASSLGDLQVSWPLWVSSSSKRTDLRALKLWDSNSQCYSDSLSIRLTFLPTVHFWETLL